MLKLLLDEHISQNVAKGLRRQLPKQIVHTLVEWQERDYLEQPDAIILGEAERQQLTLVTYDLRTIPPLLKRWTEENRRHGGVVFVDGKTIHASNVGGLIRALEALIESGSDWDWRDRISFLLEK